MDLIGVERSSMFCGVEGKVREAVGPL
jgi:hypothetical protein